jgi:hypothetical protein
MRRRYLFAFLVVCAALVLVARARLQRGSAGIPTPTAGPGTPTIALDCCQCTAIGRDQGDPFDPEPGSTCADLCYKGCLERGHGKLTCTLGRVSGHAVVCPGPLQPTASATPTNTATATVAPTATGTPTDTLTLTATRTTTTATAVPIATGTPTDTLTLTATRTTTPTVALDCCQCTALGRDQGDPFQPEPGYTCVDLCYSGCLERGQTELTCTLGRVSGHAVVCPGLLRPTATP